MVAAGSRSGDTDICIVTRSLEPDDLQSEASLGMTALAQRLAAAGRSVTLLWLPQYSPNPEKIEKMRDYYQTDLGIELELFEHSDQLIWRFSNAQHYSFGIDSYLRQRNFSDVFIPLEEGLAYYLLLAKETGVFKPRSTIHVVASAPIDWSSEADRFFLRGLEQVRISFMEKYCATQADRLICASRELHQWMLSKEWKLASSVDVIPLLSPIEWEAETDPDASGNGAHAVELVPLVGARYRDGITLFCDVLDKLSDLSDLDFKVTFAGKFFRVLGEHSGGMYLRRGRRWRHALRFARNLDQLEAIRYAKQAGAIAVIPNIENVGGFLAGECIRMGVPFVATAVGGNEGIVDEKSRKHSLCKADATALADLIGKKARERAIALPALTEKEKFRKWTALLRKPRGAIAGSARTGKKRTSGQPLVSVVVVHHDRPQYLLQAIASLEEQDYQNFEVVLVDDGSKLPESAAMLDRLERQFKRRKWRIIRAENKYVGAARNTGVRASRGEFIIFADDDNALLPGAISTYVSAILKSDADVCTALCKNFYGPNVPGSPRFNFVGYLPLGGSLDVSLVESCFGDTMSIYRRSVFDKVGYQLEKFGYMVEDYEFFVRICLAGLKIRVIPEALFLYRISTRGRYRSSHLYDNHMPVLRAFAKAGFAGLETIYSLVIGQNKSIYEQNSFRTNLGYSPSDSELLRLCDMDPNEEKAIRLLAKIAADEARPETAIGLLSSMGPNVLADEVKKLSVASTASLDALRTVQLSSVLETLLSAEHLRLAETHSTTTDDAVPMSYVEEPGKLFLEAGGGFTSIAVIAAACPVGTSAVRCQISLPEVKSEAADFLLLLCPMYDDPLVAAAADHRTCSEGSSGWIEVLEPSASAQIEVQLPTPASLPMNLVLAVRAHDGSRKAVLGCFESVQVRAAIEDRTGRRPRFGAPAHRLRARQWTNEERMRVKVVQSYPSTLPVVLFPKKLEGGVFLRPAKEGPVVAVLEEGFPQFARQLLAQIEVAHDEAPPIEFALALTLPTKKVEWRVDGPKSPIAFSGWVRAKEKFKLQDIGLRIAEQVHMNLTISLAVRLARGSGTGPTNAFFRNLQFLWDE